MITDPASAIKREVLQLIDFQIETLRRDSSLNSSELIDYKARSEKIRTLYVELDRIGRTRVEFKVPRPPMRDNNILSRHIKPAARKLGLPWINWRLPANFACDLDGPGRSQPQRRARPDATFSDLDDNGHLCTVRAGVTTARTR
jgi:hypothetical protein